MARRRHLSMQEMHHPTNTEESSDKTAEAVETVSNALPVGTLRNQPQHDTCEQRKQNGNFKMIKVYFHCAPG